MGWIDLRYNYIQIIHSKCLGFSEIVINLYNSSLNNYQNNTKYILYTFNMKSTTAGQCLSDSELVTVTTSGIGLVCVSDYNPYMTNNCGNKYQHFLDNTETVQCTAKCTCTSNMCLTDQGTNTCQWNNASCDHKDINFANNQLYWAIGNGVQNDFITCGYANGIDFARFNSAVVPNISSPLNTFNLDMWVYAQSYVGVNFDSFTVTWDRHIKFKLRYTGGNFIGSCYPVIDKNNPANDPSPINIIYANASWVYVNCGVDRTTNSFYFTNNGTVPPVSAYTSINTVTGSSVTLSFDETSPNGHGVTYIRQLRLWNCYSCSIAYKNM